MSNSTKHGKVMSVNDHISNICLENQGTLLKDVMGLNTNKNLY